MALLQITSTMISAPGQTHLMDCQQHELDKMLKMLINFSDLFEEPCGLPPAIECDHAIVLKEGTKTCHATPYKYPHAHKEEIERQIDKLVE